MTSRTDANNNVSTTYSYDQTGRQTNVTEDSSGLKRQTNTSYDDANQQEGDGFIAKKVQEAQQDQADWIASGHTGLSPKALTAFGNALHTATDRTSPAHAGNQPWYNDR